MTLQVQYRYRYLENPDPPWEYDTSAGIADLDQAIDYIRHDKRRYPHLEYRVVDASGAVIYTYGGAPDPRAVLARSLAYHGFDTQLYQTSEELCELIVELSNPVVPLAKLGRALSHLSRGRVQSIAEEIADVEIMLEQLRLHLGDDDIDAAKDAKIQKLSERLDRLESAETSKRKAKK